MYMNSFEIIVFIELNTCSLYYLSLLTINVFVFIWTRKKGYGCKRTWESI